MSVFDVVVVGGGGAGLAAAIEARALGREVVLLEKNGALGGSTAWSIGSITASATPHQIRKGIKDRPEDHFLDMALFAGELDGRDNPQLRRILCEALPDTFRWLEGLGVRFYGPMPEPPHKQPRMHNVLPSSRSYIVHLERRARRLGVAVRTGCRARALLCEGERVVGVEVEGGSSIRARGAVVLAAGDFTAGTALKERFMGEREARVEAVNPTATGDGQEMGLALGARVVNGDLALGPELRFVPPPEGGLIQRLPPWPLLATTVAWSLDHLPPALLRPFVMGFVTTALAPSPALFEEGAILVNRQGERFGDELDQPAYALAEQEGKAGFILLDVRLARMFQAWPHYISTAPGVAYAYLSDYRRNRPDVYAEAADPQSLGQRLKMKPGALAATVATYNGAAGNRPRLERGPYVALGPVRPVFVHAEGGLAVDDRHRVLGADDRPIPGLYAAGATGQGGLLLKGHGHHLAWAFVSGRRAGRHAAFEVASGEG
jgi:succinate dehydrogenase/fumarate reductase flavoprotein subunit